MENKSLEVFVSKLPKWIDLSEGSLNHQLLEVARNTEFTSIQTWFMNFKEGVRSNINPPAESTLMKLLDEASGIQETETRLWLVQFEKLLIQHHGDFMQMGYIGIIFDAIKKSYERIAEV